MPEHLPRPRIPCLPNMFCLPTFPLHCNGPGGKKQEAVCCTRELLWEPVPERRQHSSMLSAKLTQTSEWHSRTRDHSAGSVTKHEPLTKERTKPVRTNICPIGRSHGPDRKNPGKVLLRQALPGFSLLCAVSQSRSEGSGQIPHFWFLITRRSGTGTSPLRTGCS